MSGGLDHVEPTIYELFERVRAHPNYVFGTIFTRGDFYEGANTDEFPAHVAEGQLAELGNAIIASQA